MAERKLWLWKNFVDGRQEYWALDNLYPCYPGGDPMVLGEPCGYALVKESFGAKNDHQIEPVNEVAGKVCGLGRPRRSGALDICALPAGHDGRHGWEPGRDER